LKARRVIGVDFDNTIVSYDALFHKIARERAWITEDVPVNKSDVRNFLRRIGREDDWTEMQGLVYGGRMAEAAIFPGLKDFFKACKESGHVVNIISHKTRHPFRGELYDLHAAAMAWLDQEGFFSETPFAVGRDNVFLELTREAKLSRIGSQACDFFIDDLPEFLAEPGFPSTAAKVLFDPNDLYSAETHFQRIQNWNEAEQVCLK
jgi:hypothetical protein